VQTVSALTICAVYLVVPITLLAYLACVFHQSNLRDEEQRFGALFELLDLQKGVMVLINKIMFIVRRLWLAILIVFG